MLKAFKIKSYIRLLILYTAFCLIYLFIRNFVEQNTKYNFLLWNLFLGFVPFLIALLTYTLQEKLNKLVIGGASLLWLVFYPNAPYMITDFIHVQPGSSMVIYDALLIFSFSMLSLFFGFYSLMLIDKLLLKHLSNKKAKAIVFFAILASSFGIYLGRILRLNSWDFFTDFWVTTKTIFNHLFPITKNPETYLMIVLFTIIQLLLLYLTKNIDNE